MTQIPYPTANQPERVDWRVWWRLARPFSLTASVIPVLVGSAVAFASGQMHAPMLFVLMLVSSIFIQIATNMFNEYFDYRHGLDTPETVGIAGAIVRGLIPAGRVFAAAVACFVVAFLLGLVIVFNTSPAVLIAGIVSALAGFLYTGGPLPIAYTPFGEVEVFIFMGPVIVGLAYFIQAGSLSASAIWGAMPVACLVASILLANNLRDVVADGAVGRHTIPVSLGRSAGLVIYTALLAGAYLSVLGAVGLGLLPWTSLLPLVTIRTPIRLVGLYRAIQEPRPLNAGVRGSAGLHARFGLLLALGIALGVVIGWTPPTL